MSTRLTVLIAVACGAIVANIYYLQPIVTEVALTLGLRAEHAGTIATLAQVGYCLGLLFLVPLGDLIENRRLSIAILALSFFAAATMVFASSPAVFLTAALTRVGVGHSAGVAAIFGSAGSSGPTRRGRWPRHGRNTHGDHAVPTSLQPRHGLDGWRAILAVAATTSAIAALLILWLLPERHPAAGLTYGGMIRSLASLAVGNRLLHQRALYQCLMFYSYTLFWTAVPALLVGPVYGLEQTEVALFALAGAAGALTAPLGGRLADRGLTGIGTGVALMSGTLAWVVAFLGDAGGALGLSALFIAALFLDGAVPVSLVMGQRELFASAPDQRARLNGLFMAAFFMGGATVASLGVWSLHSAGWVGAVACGGVAPLLALLAWLLSYQKQRRSEERNLT